MPSLEEIRLALATHEPSELDAGAAAQAAVALVLRQVAGAPELLFIERARRAGDPWSGHMAFPGGRVGAEDAHPRGAAERETLEEVGVSLASAEPLGRLDDMQGHRSTGQAGIVISAFVYHVVDPPALVPNHEVREAFWFPLRALLDPERHVVGRRYAGTQLPGILVGRPERHVVWGLTYRFLERFFEVLGRPLPGRD